MIVSHRDTAPRRGTSDHRPGGIGFIALLQGEPGAIDNFDLSLSHTTEEFHTPRHRHNFDQLRYILKGEFSFDRGRVQRCGQISYFGEGVYYEQQGIGETETLLLQTAGASGSGYMSFDQLYATAHKLLEKGRFEDGVFTWVDAQGRKHNADGYQAVWEEVNGRKIAYPKPRYDGPVILNPANFDWVAAEEPGVAVRELGSFNGRGLAISQVRLDAGTSWTVRARPSRTLLFVEDGAGSAAGQPLHRHSAARIERGESIVVSASAPMILVWVQLPSFDRAMAA